MPRGSFKTSGDETRAHVLHDPTAYPGSLDACTYIMLGCNTDSYNGSSGSFGPCDPISSSGTRSTLQWTRRLGMEGSRCRDGSARDTVRTFQKRIACSLGESKSCSCDLPFRMQGTFLTNIQSSCKVSPVDWFLSRSVSSVSKQRKKKSGQIRTRTGDPPQSAPC